MLKIDLHIHSINSGHAYGSFYDIVNEAKSKNMDLIAITDHGPNMVGTSGHIHFHMGDRAPKQFGNLKVLWGCEANVISGNGEIDLSEKLCNELDIVLLGFHGNSGYKDLGKEKNTIAMKKALQNPAVKILTHPTHHQYDCDFEEILNCAIENNVILELNLSYLEKYGEKHLDRFKKLVDFVKSKKKKLIVNSDAHFIHEIGDDSILKKYSKKIGLTKNLILNNYPKELKKILKIN